MWLGSHVVMAVEYLAATAPTGPLAWEPPYATGAALKKRQKKKKERERERERKIKENESNI